MEEKILVPLDDSDESWNAFRHALLQAEEKDFDRFVVIYSEKKAGDEEYREGEEILDEVKKKAAGKDIEVETKLSIRGYDPAEDIVRFAEEEGFDRIIVGHKSGGPIRDVLLGSVAKGVVENAHCVVSVVRATPYFEKSGERIRPRTIESLLEEHEGVEKSAVISGTDAEGYEKIVAFFEPREGYEPQEEMIMDFLKGFREEGILPNFAVPDEIVRLKTLPRTIMGTINRDKLKAKHL